MWNSVGELLVISQGSGEIKIQLNGKNKEIIYNGEESPFIHENRLITKLCRILHNC